MEPRQFPPPLKATASPQSVPHNGRRIISTTSRTTSWKRCSQDSSSRKGLANRNRNTERNRG